LPDNAGDIAQRILEQARKKADAAEVLYDEAESAGVRYQDNQLKTVSGSSSSGVGLRVIHRGRLGFSCTNDLSAVRAALRPETRVLYAETIGNPTLRVADIDALARIARKARARLLIDNTFASPYLCRPLELGADLAIHSATKYLSGHADTIAGVVVGDAARLKPVRELVRVTGGVLAPFSAFLLCRGLKTLALRMDRACTTAQRLAEYLSPHPRIERVYYPGLRSHPDHRLAARQLRAPGGMVAFEVAGGLEAAARFQDALKLIVRAASLGECHTLVTHPASTTHRMFSREERRASGITDALVRLSAGLEDVEDLAADLEQALAERREPGARSQESGERG
jgi:methionine-gamma-lyase